VDPLALGQGSEVTWAAETLAQQSATIGYPPSPGIKEWWLNISRDYAAADTFISETVYVTGNWTKPFDAIMLAWQDFVSTVGQTLSGGVLSPFAALFHYVQGSGDAMSVRLQDLGLHFEADEVQPLKDFVAAHAAQTNQPLQVSGDFAYNTANDSLVTASYMGNITLHYQGEVTISPSGNYHFTGQITAYNDVYDANPSTHRGPIGEASTHILGLFGGTSYEIAITGGQSVVIDGSIH
jgi:hypothetical protein